MSQKSNLTNKPSAIKSPRKKRIDWDGALEGGNPAALSGVPKTIVSEQLCAYRLDTHNPVFLEQELRQVTRRAKRGKGSIDKLARVCLHSMALKRLC